MIRGELSLELREDPRLLKGLKHLAYFWALGRNLDANAMDVGQGCQALREGLDEGFISPRAGYSGLDVLDGVAGAKNGSPLSIPVG